MYVMFLFLLLLYYVYNDTIYHTMYALYNIKRNVLLYIKYLVQYTPVLTIPPLNCMQYPFLPDASHRTWNKF